MVENRVKPDSVLRNLPDGLSEKQIFMLDGIRYAADISGIALDKLWEVLQKLDTENDHAPLSNVEAAMYAWTIVDSCYKMVQLLDGLPGFNKRRWFQNFRSDMDPVEELRHAWQHQRGEATAAVQRRDQAYGAIAWVKHLDGHPTGKWFCAIAGSDLPGSQWTFAGPMNSIPGVDSRRIRLLYGADKSFYLARAVNQVFKAIRALENDLSGGLVRLFGNPTDASRGQDMVLETSIYVALLPSPDTPNSDQTGD